MTAKTAIEYFDWAVSPQEIRSTRVNVLEYIDRKAEAALGEYPIRMCYRAYPVDRDNHEPVQVSRLGEDPGFEVAYYLCRYRGRRKNGF